MMRILLLAFLALIVVLNVPALRKVLQPPAQKALGPAIEVVVTPVKKWQAKSGCTNLLRELSIAYNQGRSMPDPYNFTAWAKRVTNSETGGQDPWGRRYYFKPGRGLMTVGSPGPDGFRDTPDDIIATVPWGSS
jgi:hypothetical protein